MNKQVLLTIKKHLVSASKVLFTLLIAVGLAKMLKIRFSNPDLTETRLLIEFGWEYAKIFGLMALGALIHWGNVRTTKTKV